MRIRMQYQLMLDRTHFFIYIYIYIRTFYIIWSNLCTFHKTILSNLTTTLILISKGKMLIGVYIMLNTMVVGGEGGMAAGEKYEI